MQGTPSAPAPDPLRGLKRMTVLSIILLSVQAWTGDVVNLFNTPPQGPVSGLGGFFQTLESAGPGPLALYHALEGVIILMLGVGIVVAAFRRNASHGVKVTSLLGLLSIASAAVGGYLFVFSGFVAMGIRPRWEDPSSRPTR